MKRHIAGLLALIISPTIQAQTSEFTHEFGIITPKEIELMQYDKDPEADALILFDIGESIFFDTDNGYDIRFTRTKRIKVFNRTGISNSEVSIPFYVDGYGKTERIRSIEAFTYNFENGHIIKKEIDPTAIYEEQLNNRWKIKKFVFPDVKEGSIIEYKYILETPFHFNLPDWTFQDKIPTLYSQYRVSMIPFYEYVFLAQGITKWDYQKSEVSNEKRTWGSVNKSYGQNVGSGIEFQDFVHTYVLKDVPAFKDESYITAREDYLIKMDMQLSKFNNPRGGHQEIITTWPALNKQLLDHEHFGKFIKSCGKITRKILEEELVLESKTDLEKSEIIIDYVKDKFTWNQVSDKYASKSAKDFFSQKIGNSADINLFLYSLLKQAGIRAQPVILSTRGHGKIKSDYPFAHFFNYVSLLIQADSYSFLTDATDHLISFDRVPTRCINEKGLIVQEGQTAWVNFENSIVSLDNKIISLNIDPKDLKIKAAVTIQTSEYESYNYKNTYHNDTIKLKRALENGIFKEIQTIKTFNYNENKKPYVISFIGETAVESLSNKIIVSPFLNFPIHENQLKQQKRSYPVDFIYARKKQFKSTINIPNGFKIISLPENFKMDNDLAEINLDFKVDSTHIDAYGTYTLKKSIYNTQDYTKIKYYIDLIVKKFNEQIIMESF